MRRSYERIRGLGADVVAVGTGDVRYARAFVEQEDVPFTVVVDDDGRAAEIASVKVASWLKLAGPQTYAGAVRALARGSMQHRTGKRPKQLGATFVVGPGEVVRYEHIDDDAADHAPLDDVLAAITA